MNNTALSVTSPRAVYDLFSHLHTGVDAEHNIRKLLFQLCPKLCHRGALIISGSSHRGPHEYQFQFLRDELAHLTEMKTELPASSQGALEEEYVMIAQSVDL